MGDRAAFWQRLREFAQQIKVDSVRVGPASIRFQQRPSKSDAFAAVAEKFARESNRPNDTFVISAHNVDEVTVVDEIAADHECEALTTTELHPGGSGANTAYVLSVLGARVSIAGCVGSDSNGALLLASLADSGVDTAHVRVIAGPSGRTQNIVDRRGRRLLVVEANANNSFIEVTAESELVNAARDARILHLSSFVDERAIRLQAQVAAACSDNVISLVPGALYARRGLDRLGTLLEHVDVMFVYREQLQAMIIRSSASTLLLGDTLQDELRAYFAWRGAQDIDHPTVVVVKDPIQNESHFVAQRFLSVAAGRTTLERFFYPRELPRGAEIRTVDTTGAGDAAAAAFLYAMLRGAPMEDSLDAAFLVASFASTAVGARSSFSGSGPIPIENSLQHSTQAILDCSDA